MFYKKLIIDVKLMKNVFGEMSLKLSSCLDNGD